MRGQPLLFLGTVVLLWTVARIVHHLPEGEIAAAPIRMAEAGPSHLLSADAEVRSNMRGGALLGTLAMLGAPAARAAPVARLGPARHSRIAPIGTDFDIAMAHQLLWMESLTTGAGPAGQAGSPLVDGPLLVEPERSAPHPDIAGAAPAPATHDRKWSIYAWSLLRQGARSRALAPGAQYGGSQAGLIVRYGLRDGPFSPSVYARAATALASSDDRTLAIGIAGRPWGAVPVDLAVERRFGLANGQRDRFAAMLVAGGGGSIGRSQVRVDAFGQAGVVGLGEPQGFFDLQVLATRQVVSQDDHSITLGGGVWAGGQQEIDPRGGKGWVHRVDLGPRATVSLPLGNAGMTVALDWRQRVDGNALPASGAAITVSTGF